MTKWIRLPYSIALVIVGLFIGVFHCLPVVTMTPDLILLVFLPALLFEASWNLQLEWLKSCFKPVSLLATVGVLISAVVVGFVVHVITGIDFKVGLLFGAMISATDPISVLALFKKLRVNRRLHMILEGESLLNDGTAVALFKVLLASMLIGSDLSWTKIGMDFFLMTFGGMLVGAAVGYISSKVTEYFDDHLLETTLTVLVAYGSYILAEQFKVSSVIAVLVAGFIMGNFGSRKGMSATTRVAVDSFWEYAAFIAESLVFLLIGMQIKYDLVVKYSPFILAGIVAILIARVVVVYLLCLFSRSKRLPIPLAWQHILFWGGLRGSLCMAMALSLPESFPQREMLVVTTFGVALFTLLVPGLTMEPLVRWMKVSAQRLPKATQIQNEIDKLEREKKNIQLAFKSGQLSSDVYKKKIQEIESQLKESKDTIELLEHSESSEDEVERLFIETALVRAQKACILQLAKKDTAKPEVLEEFRQRIDMHYLAINDAHRTKDMQDPESNEK
ncbi:MAG: Na+/H+ antiporter [Candidatus Obscuribacterales bacterium]|nr:Na+/H+ antiporter [Candidatus Obscuribacterales bacterium]